MPAPKNKYLMMSLVIALLLSLVAYLLLRTAPMTDPIPAQTATAPPKSRPEIPTPKPERPSVQRILFAGDSMMQGIAPIIMRQLKASHPEWLLRNESQQSTGLTVKRRLDWVQKIKTEIVEHKLTTVAVFLGPNDPWDIYEKKQVIRFPSPEWEAIYSARVSEICEFAKEKKVHLIWIGLPTMKEKRVHSGATVQNPIFRDNMKRYGFDFISTEALIGYLDQPYVRAMTDQTGKKINLRADDGIHFSPQGLQRIAAAVVKTIDPPDNN
jgi:hypothetical protein